VQHLEFESLTITPQKPNSNHTPSMLRDTTQAKEPSAGKPKKPKEQKPKNLRSRETTKAKKQQKPSQAKKPSHTNHKSFLPPSFLRSFLPQK
jgi:hypothetical protein